MKSRFAWCADESADEDKPTPVDFNAENQSRNGGCKLGDRISHGDSNRVHWLRAVMVRAVVVAEIPSKVVHWVQMDDDEYYVADLVQLPNGSRYLQPRRPDDETTPHTVFTTRVATGRELKNCQTGQDCVLLTDGNKFAMDAHGIWMTIPEANTLFHRASNDDEHPPWVNGIPPRFPPK